MIATSSVSVVNVNDGQDGSPGAQGPQGISITGTKEQWFLSTSNQRTEGTAKTITVDGESIKVGQWTYEEPVLIPDGYYLWGRIENIMSSGPNTYSDAVHRSVISGIKSIVDEDHNVIESKVWETYTQNQISSYDGSTVESIREDVSDLTQDLSGITTRVGNAESAIATKADGSTVQTLSENFSTFQQTMNGFKTTVEQNYAQTSYVDSQISNIKVGGNNLYIIADQVPGYLHQSSGAIIAQNATGKEFTSAYIPVKQGESVIIQSWCTPLTDQDEYNAGYSWLAYQFFSDDDPVTPVGSRVAKWGYTSGSGVEITADGKEHLMYKATTPTNANYLRVSYRRYKDGYAMVEKATTPSEYAINPKDIEAYTNSQVSSVRTIAEQTADKFTWLVDSGDSASNFTLTSRVAELISPQVIIKDPSGNSTIITGGKITANSITTSMLATDAIKSSNYQDGTDEIYSASGTFLDLLNGNIRTPNFVVDNTNSTAYIDGTISARYLFLGLYPENLDSSTGTLSSVAGMLQANVPTSDNYIYYDGDVLVINTQNFRVNGNGDAYLSGSIYSTSGNIAGWEITANAILKQYVYNNTSGYVYMNSDPNSPMFGVYYGDEWKYYVQSDGYLFAKNAQISGNITASYGNIGSWIITPNGLSYGTIAQTNSASLIPVGSSSAYTIGGSGVISGWVFTAGSTFGVTNTGSVYATSGKIGGLSISSDSLYVGDAGVSSNQSKYAFWAGETNDANGDSTSNAVFRVSHNGKLIAENVDISGKIFASSGNIGGFTIRNNDILNDLGFNWETTIDNVNYTYWCGLRQKGGSASQAPGSIRMFEITRQPTGGEWRSQMYIGSDGVIYAVDARLLGGTIGGFTINSTGIDGGKLHLYSNNTSTGVKIASTSGTYYENKLDEFGLSCESSYYTVTIGTYAGNQGINISNIQYGSMAELRCGYDNGIWCTNSNGHKIGFFYNNNNNVGIYDYDSSNGRWIIRHDTTGNRVWLGTGSYTVRMGDGDTSGTTTFMPRTYANDAAADNAVYLGASSSRWKAVYAANGTIQTSDERLKTIHRYLGEDHKKLFMHLKPIEYSFNTDPNEIHFGLGAQTTEKSMKEFGFDSKYKIVEHSYYDEKDLYGRYDTYNMNYIEVSMLAIPVVQEHEKEIIKLKEKIKELENRLSELQMDN